MSIKKQKNVCRICTTSGMSLLQLTRISSEEMYAGEVWFATYGSRIANHTGSKSRFGINHPGRTKSIGAHTKAFGPECLLKRYVDVASLRESVEDALTF